MATNSSVLLEFPFKVKKKSGNPFKSGKKVNKAIGTIKNEKDPMRRDAFIFEDDDSIVNVDMCEVIFN